MPVPFSKSVIVTQADARTLIKYLRVVDETLRVSARSLDAEGTNCLFDAETIRGFMLQLETRVLAPKLLDRPVARKAKQEIEKV